VRSLTHDDTLYAVNSRKLLTPASSMKIVTLAAAADRLGWDYSYETQIRGAGAIEAGVLEGDLLVVGNGDPSIDDWDGAATSLFQQWADRLKTLGIRIVRNRLVGDDNTFDAEALGAGWAWDDLSSSYATGVGALQFNQNTARVTLTPGPAVGDAAVATVAPASSGLTLDNGVTTSVAGEPTPIVTRRLPGSSTLEMRGALPVDSQPVFRNVSVDNPTLYFGTALRDGLAVNGVEVHGPVTDIDAITNGPSRDEGAALVIHRSPPLSVLAATMMKNSQNLYAETLLKTLGLVEGTGSTDAGRRVIWSVLEPWGVMSSDLQIADGSGLSRYNLATAEALVTVLARVHQNDRLREPFEAALPVAGRDGTLERRLIGTAADNNVRAKTGSLSNARTLTGYVWTADREPLAFSIIANNFGAGSAVVDTTIDAIVVRLAEFTRAAGR
jgi:D-alanyl-D-alanine carboxypeptidase/D-alanyl-D-alanine-endopeptidase (penicillin-binding protein 4)